MESTEKVLIHKTDHVFSSSVAFVTAAL